ncbi:MAG: tRNA (adenosine(37)-N6)-threonylcarbamoyltransferase complex dimerization subunit type 1 TsaB [Ruminococcus sp.]|nr:tRNA (adenosine(37)-N6)-threonylcarbamoyltransferase complex dimerization subunit type 1 TsaB [Ruminococcus sp.]MBQ1686660.1 tRNA (adenosine(37)-N6)-threonylcarbamoyltransferase complex dimerization subunit type 1 TsaB [Ruminococcus sp.]MBQ3989033.1 tRNA (adenosine(37)-N6)-threonylcarbamoyltransferase complex dimerization subunit type 1 TsaB [Ruminococcus sp.]
MTVLAMDTSAKAASVCLAEEDKIIGEFFINTGLTHSQTLMPMAEQLCKNAGVPLDNIDAVAVNAGPGSFTGVRIGVAAAKGLAFAHDLPCVAVSTLESMAYNMLGCDGVVCALMDARCGQVYNALFRVTGNRVERLCDDRAIALSELQKELQGCTERVVFVGDGAAISFKSAADLPACVRLAPMNKVNQTAASVALAAFERLKAGDTCTPAELMPVYLRLPQAQRELNKRMGVQP